MFRVYSQQRFMPSPTYQLQLGTLPLYYPCSKHSECALEMHARGTVENLQHDFYVSKIELFEMGCTLARKKKFTMDE